jgi:hypothetical protein
VSRGDDEVLREQALVARNSSIGRKNFSKIFEKPLDKSIQMCYNIYVERERTAIPYDRKGVLKK